MVDLCTDTFICHLPLFPSCQKPAHHLPAGTRAPLPCVSYVQTVGCFPFPVWSLFFFPFQIQFSDRTLSNINIQELLKLMFESFYRGNNKQQTALSILMDAPFSRKHLLHLQLKSRWKVCWVFWTSAPTVNGCRQRLFSAWCRIAPQFLRSGDGGGPPPSAEVSKKDFPSVGDSEICVMELEAELYRELSWCQ